MDDNKKHSKEELSKYTKIVKEAVDYNHNNLTNLSMETEGVTIDKFGTTVFNVHGGLNGNGRWNNYFTTLSKLVSKLFELNFDCWLIEMKIDVDDDVFTATFGIKEE